MDANYSSQGIHAKRLRNFSFIWIFHWWIFNRENLLFCSARSSAPHPNFLLTKKFIRKLSSQFLPQQPVEIAQILSEKPSYNTSI